MTEREKKKQREQERASTAFEYSLLKELLDEKAEDRFDGDIERTGYPHIDETGLWRIPGEAWNEDQLINLDALLKESPDLIGKLIDAFPSRWRTARGLLGYMTEHYTGPRPYDVPMPEPAYLLRVLIAAQGGDTSEILDRIRFTGVGQKRRFTCVGCERKFAALCPRCRGREVRRVRRKPITSEKHTAQVEAARPPAASEEAA